MSKNKFPPFVRHVVLWAMPILALSVVMYLWWRALDQQTRALPSSSGTPSKILVGVFRPTREQWAGLKIAEVKAMSFRNVLVTDGNIAFNDDAMTMVFSPYSGRVSRLVAKLGDQVKKGAPLMAIEASEFVQGRSDVASARASADTARATERRQHDLFDAGTAALKEWRQAQSDLVIAEAAWNAARGRLRILGKTDAEIDVLENTSTRLTEAVVVAPITGTVTQRLVGIGQYIQSATGGASSPVFTISDLSRVWLVANVREGDAPTMRVGQTAEVSVMALPGRKFRAVITWIGSAVDPVTHRLPVRAEIQNPSGELKPQMFASFSIATGEATEAPAVPQSALIYDNETTRIFVVGADGTVSGQPVRVGRSSNGLVEIVSGARAGDRVVTSGTLFIDRATESD